MKFWGADQEGSLSLGMVEKEERRVIANIYWPLTMCQALLKAPYTQFNASPRARVLPSRFTDDSAAEQSRLPCGPHSLTHRALGMPSPPFSFPFCLYWINSKCCLINVKECIIMFILIYGLSFICSKINIFTKFHVPLVCDRHFSSSEYIYLLSKPWVVTD